MGLSSSKTKTTSTTSQTGRETSRGTQMPLTPAWLTEAAQDYVGRIGAFGEMDPNAFVAPASPLQRMAWANAGALSGWQGQARTAAEMAQKAGNAGPHVAQAPAMAQGSTYAAPALGPAQGYAAPPLASPSLVSGQGYAAPRIAEAQGYAAARAGAPIGATASGYDPARVGNVTVGATPDARATNAQAASLLDNFSAYQSPYTQGVVNASLAEYDQGVAEQRARLAAQGARAGAFGGSRFGLAEGQLAADAARGRATTAAQLLDQGFRTAADLSSRDAAARQAASLFNAGNETQVSLANAERAAARELAQAGFTMQAGLANQQAANQAASQRSAAENAASMFNADLAGRFALDQAGRADAAARFGAEAGNARGLAQAGLEADAARFGADTGFRAQLANQQAQQQADIARAGLQADAARFGAAAGNEFALRGADLAAGAGQFNAAAQNAAAMFNAGSQNDMARFNAGQQEQAHARALQAAQLLQSGAGQFAGDTRADLQTMAALGDQQRGIEQAYALAPLAQLQAMGQLSGMTPYDILVGRAIGGTTSSATSGTGTQVTRSSPSLFNQLLAAGNLAASFIGGGE